jgi:hypothetical protein
VTRQKCIRTVQRFFAMEKRIEKVHGRSRSGMCELYVHRRSGTADVHGSNYVIARAKSWDLCLRHLIPPKRVA